MFVLTAAQAAPLHVAVGQRAPAFMLKDQNGRPISLDSLLRNGPVALVFIRSADWCVYCQLQLLQIQANLKQIEASGGRVVAISYDAPATLKRFAIRHNITLPLLSDTGSKTIDAYDMRSPVATGHQLGCAQHGTFIIDQRGFVRSKLNLASSQADSLVATLSTALKKALTPESPPRQAAPGG